MCGAQRQVLVADIAVVFSVCPAKFFDLATSFSKPGRAVPRFYAAKQIKLMAGIMPYFWL
jgi:hypothetical protein